MFEVSNGNVQGSCLGELSTAGDADGMLSREWFTSALAAARASVRVCDSSGGLECEKIGQGEKCRCHCAGSNELGRESNDVHT